MQTFIEFNLLPSGLSRGYNANMKLSMISENEPWPHALIWGLCCSMVYYQTKNTLMHVSTQSTHVIMCTRSP